MKTLTRFKLICEYLGGAHDEIPEPQARFLRTSLWRGLWWGILVGAIVMFCGQTSKFIYIDF